MSLKKLTLKSEIFPTALANGSRASNGSNRYILNDLFYW
jgi:hypothetical protein